MDAHAAIGELIAEIEASEKIRIVLAGLVGQKESQQLRESRKLRFVGSLSSLGNFRGLGSLIRDSRDNGLAFRLCFCSCDVYAVVVLTVCCSTGS